MDLTLIPLNSTVHKVRVSFRRLPAPNETVVLPFLDDGTLDMASSFDLFHEISHHDSPYVTDPVYTSNRNLLRSAMQARGFRMLQEEWWHYTLNQEPFPTTFIDFVVPCNSSEARYS